MDRLRSSWLSFCGSITATTGAIFAIAGVVAVVTTGWAIFWNWVTHLVLPQMVLFGIATLAILVILSTIIISWWYKKNIQNMPNLLAQYDRMMSDYCTNADFSNLNIERLGSLMSDLDQITGLNSKPLRDAMQSQSKTDTEKQWKQISKRYQNLLGAASNKEAERLGHLLLMGQVLDDYGCGLSKLTNSKIFRIV